MFGHGQEFGISYRCVLFRGPTGPGSVTTGSLGLAQIPSATVASPGGACSGVTVWRASVRWSARFGGASYGRTMVKKNHRQVQHLLRGLLFAVSFAVVG